MSSRTGDFMLMILLFFQICYVFPFTNYLDTSALKALKDEWSRFPESWEGSDPCGTNWIGISCSNGRVISISLGNINLEGKLSGNISFLSELQILDLSYNVGLSGPLPPNIGDLKKLRNLILVECSFSGQIPESIGSLEQLVYLHFANNKLSGDIPEKLFSSNMTLIHVLFDGNRFTGKIPYSVTLLKTLTVLRLDRNRLSGDIPSGLNNLTNLGALIRRRTYAFGQQQINRHYSNFKQLEPSSHIKDGREPTYRSNTDVPLQPYSVEDYRNRINETLDFGTINSSQLEFVDLQNNEITDYKPPANKRFQVILADNPVCRKWGKGLVIAQQSQQTVLK
ncbi:unnamed protein product [Arabis nemorensis]|uniref:Leucine-rich repeat-containing N-terminal plant-type domain-containing protein n=1 Tax=Arabis nemorensis TaxID=586526 RepID=A0A565CQZ8_9BRAS|nr:unnamed protein product [Arabis nemorensis]